MKNPITEEYAFKIDKVIKHYIDTWEDHNGTMSVTKFDFSGEQALFDQLTSEQVEEVMDIIDYYTESQNLFNKIYNSSGYNQYFILDKTKMFFRQGGFIQSWKDLIDQAKQEREDKQAADKVAKLDLQIKKLQIEDLVYKKDMQALEKKVKLLQKTNLYLGIGLAVTTALTLAFNFGKLLATLGI